MNLSEMTKGWFIGDFEPTAYKTTDFEVGIKEYKAGDYEPKHLHKVAKEFTVVVSGRVKMNGVEYGKGEIIQINEFDATDFECIEDCVTVVVKTKSVKGDKYIQ
jgi:hypothetical protein